MSARGRRPLASWVSATIAVLAIVAFGMLSLPASADDEDDEPGGLGTTTLQFDVVGSVPNPLISPTPTPTQPPNRPGGGSGGSGSSGGGAGGSVPVPVPAPTRAPDEVSVGGYLFVGGIQAGYDPAPNPLGGTVMVRFALRNVSGVSIDSVVQLTLRNPFGARVGNAHFAWVRDLAPGETRVIVDALPGVGLWTLPSAAITVTPLTEIEGGRLPPMTRDTIVFAPSWPFIVLLVLAAAVALGLVVWQRIRPLRPARSEDAETPEPAVAGDSSGGVPDVAAEAT